MNIKLEQTSIIHYLLFPHHHIVTHIDARVKEVSEEELDLSGEYPHDVGDVVEDVGDEDDGGPPPHVGHDPGGGRGHVHRAHHAGESDPGPLDHA